METFNVFNEDYQCKDFFDIEGASTNISGVEVHKDGERLGSIIGVSIPDLKDLEEVEKFKNVLIDWIVDNGF